MNNLISDNHLKLLDKKLKNLKQLLETNLIENINEEKLTIISRNETGSSYELLNVRKKFFEILNLLKKSKNNQKIWNKLYNIKQIKLYYLCNISNNIILQFKDAIKSIATISTEERYSIALVSEYSKIYVKGYNSYGQLIIKKKKITEWELIDDSRLINCENIYFV